ncbi:synaptotagmin-6-like [Xenia sp. Carnegie-2017]|uniref:synaptotagmin-6-like n=1 Tax=Xenia sp. Carnegie-2017 TaxID=2897299 RepID=UPI001F03E1E8|nr:synaptotagmin-6-like [Xenia sp. Carnegie-2017]
MEDFLKSTFDYKVPREVTEQQEDEDETSTKFIIILVLSLFFAACVGVILLAILCKWLKKTKTSENMENPPLSKELLMSMEKPRHVKLMRTDSSRSVIIDNNRDASGLSTPLSPLSEEDGPLTFEKGRLEFSMFYDREQENLNVNIIQCHGLLQTSYVYHVEGTLLPDLTTRKKTTSRQHNPSPVFEEIIKFSLPFEELPERTLLLNVLELDSFSQRLPVGHLLYSFDTENNNYMDIMRIDADLSRELPQDNFDDVGVGEILVSICYMPTAGRLTVVILKCRLYEATNGLPNPFLKVSLMLNRKQLKKIKTSVKYKTLTPVYNEAFIFDVPAQHIVNVGLYGRVINEREGSKQLGKFVIGSMAGTSFGLHHWENMMLRPRKPIALWHKIL